MIVDTKHMAVKASILAPQKLQYGGNDTTIVSLLTYGIFLLRTLRPNHNCSMAGRKRNLERHEKKTL